MSTALTIFNRTGDIRREADDLTPGEILAAYAELNGQILARIDSYVGQAVKAKDELEAMLPLLDDMQSMLSQRGSRRKLMTNLHVPTWPDWLKLFRKSLQEDITIRTIQRRLRKYRGETPPKEINVVAKESIRHLESKPQAEKLETTVHSRKELNPAIRAELIRALKARVKRDLALIAKLENGFNPLPVAETGKAHQRLVREERAKLPDPLLEEKCKLAADFSNARVEQISYDTAKNVVLANEYLGTMGSASHCFGLYFGDHLASVVCFGSVAGTKVAASVCGPEHAKRVTVLVRGATEPWAHKNSASHLIAEACDLMAAKGFPIVVAYSDPAGGEVGQIYTAVNFLYTGMTNGTEEFITPDGKRHNSRQVHGLTRDRRNGGLKFKRTRAEQRQLLIEQGCTFERVGGKHRYVHFAGDRRTKRLLRNALRWKVFTEHPRRSNDAESDEAVDELAKGGNATLRTNRDRSCAAGIAACEEQSTARATEKPDGVSNTHCDDSSMAECPVQLGDGGSIPTSSLHFVRIEKALATELVIKHHYLHRKPIISSWETIRWKPRRVRDHRGRIKVVVGDEKSKKALCWGIERDGQIVGVCTFGAPMWSVSAGVTGGALWDVKLGYGRWYDCLELTRLWVDDSVTEHCIESKFVAWCLREIKKINPNTFIVSYADSAAGHRGVIYQALGFVYCGLSVPWTDKTVAGKDHRSVSKKMQGDKIGNRRTWAGVSAVRKTRSRKHRYVKFLNPKDVGLLAWKREPNPRTAACLSPDLA
jgi:hypothetical protein